jgi:pimeloyl-ACP methyl ester carboxylesterase
MIADMKNPAATFSSAAKGRFRVPATGGEVAGVELDYWTAGSGVPVMLVHGGILTNWFDPLADELGRNGEYRVVTFHRPGYGQSSLPEAPMTMSGHATCCLELARHLDLEPVHLVGHSIGGCIALQAALLEPGAVASVALLEPPVMTATLDPTPAFAVLRPAAGLWMGGNPAGALDTFMSGIVDPDYERVLDHLLLGWHEEALRGIDSFYRSDRPAMESWTFGADDAARVKQRAILFLGEFSTRVNAIRQPIHETLLRWLPNCEGHTIAGATHLLPLQEPAQIAAVLSASYRSAATV